MRGKKLVENERLRLLVLKSCLELGSKIDKHLLNSYGLDSDEYTFMLDVKESWFSDGCEKVEIMDSVRNKSVFICSDVYNYSGIYKMRGIVQHTSPNDLMQQLRDTIGACNGHSRELSIVMPMLYAGRQHRRNGREALTCASWLHEFDRNPAIRGIFTCDAHSIDVEQALSDTEFGSLPLTSVMLERFINDVSKDELRDIVVVSPDNGAIGRSTIVLNSFNNPHVSRYLANCYKERDYNRVVNGKNPIIAHRYNGYSNIGGMTGIIVDDIIASGESMFEVIDMLNSKGVNNIYLFSTFVLLTEGIDKFDEYYNNGKFKGVYTTNASYIDIAYRNREWLHIVDCSEFLANFIGRIYRGESTSDLFQDRSGPVKVLKKKFEGDK